MSSIIVRLVVVGRYSRHDGSDGAAMAALAQMATCACVLRVYGDVCVTGRRDVCVLRVYGDGGREQGTRAGTRRRRNSATRCHVLSQHIMPARTGARL